MSMEEQKDPLEHTEEQEEEEAFSFLQETIKDEAGGTKKTRKSILRMIGLGLVFGIAASFSFSMLKPWFEQNFQSDPEKVTIPKEEEEENTADDDGTKNNTQQVLDEESYRQMIQALNAVAQEASKSVVEINGISGDSDWLEADYDKKNSVSGLIIADNGQQLLILGKTSILKESNEVTITFYDGKTYKAGVKKKDSNLGIGIYAVRRADIQESTWSQSKIAVLGSSNSLAKGETAIALGKPFNYAGGTGYGIISSNKNVIDVADGQYRLICTDIPGTGKGTGFTVNLKGEVTGIIDQSISDEDSMKLTTAYGISDLKELIELMSNGKAVPYIGILGIDVTESIEQQGIPQGVYVKEVEVDSPAMAAGIQSGDIITSIGGAEVKTVSAYQSVLIDKEVGSKVKIRGQRQGSGGYVDIDFNVTVGSKE
ncbi:Serine protease Do-like HtrB [[Clostridium] hylemonae DSM 15053]|nr:Serine protease Do-like HtrB [[Clostridium] hylemonae DSM 15053]